MDIAIFYPDSEIQIDDDLIRGVILHMDFVHGYKPKFSSSAFNTVYALLLAGV
jgi:hypothetical protein